MTHIDLMRKNPAPLQGDGSDEERWTVGTLGKVAACVQARGDGGQEQDGGCEREQM